MPFLLRFGGGGGGGASLSQGTGRPKAPNSSISQFLIGCCDHAAVQKAGPVAQKDHAKVSEIRGALLESF